MSSDDEPFKAEDNYAPTYVTGPNGFKFLCYNGEEMARQLNDIFKLKTSAALLSHQCDDHMRCEICGSLPVGARHHKQMDPTK